MTFEYRFSRRHTVHISLSINYIVYRGHTNSIRLPIEHILYQADPKFNNRSPNGVKVFKPNGTNLL